jgi:RimJ/RimL family protein N-acetyltransferase
LPEVGAMSEIIDTGHRPPTDDEVRDIVQIESRPEVMAWDDEPIGDPDDPERSFRQFRDFFHNLERDDRICLLAKRRGRIVGFLAIGHKPDAEGVGNVSVMVSPEHWNMGIGTGLLREGVRLGRERGYNALELETLEENAAMRRIARKSGFHLTAIAPCPWKKGRLQANYQLVIGDPTRADATA